MRVLHRFAVLAVVCILFNQCQKELKYIGTGDPGATISPHPLRANLQGNIVDENNQPTENAVIKVGSETAVTNAQGYFRINNAALDKNTAVVTVEKTGYFTTYRCFSATSGTNQVLIKLTKKNLSGTVSGTNGGEVSLGNGTKVSFPADGIVKAVDNSTYSGTVNVYAAYIDPTAQDILQRVPGSFAGNDRNDKRVFLTSYGMVAVELQSAAGERLQIKAGRAATLTSPIPSSVLASAPATIPLWYIDERTGLWKEEGVATKQGNNYVGSVNHFSFWNCDTGIAGVTLSATLKTGTGQPLVNAWVVINAGKIGSASGYTDSAGQVRGLVPAGADLVLEVRDNCSSPIYSKNIGPYNDDVDLGTITVSSATPSVVTISGRLTNCGGGSVTNGYAIVSIDNWVHYAKVDASGSFSTNYILCSTGGVNVQVLGIDDASHQQGTTASSPVTAPTTDVGSVLACGNSSTQFLDYTLDGTSYSITSADSLTGFTQGQGGTSLNTYIDARKLTGDYLSFKFTHTANVAGTYPLLNMDMQANNTLYTNLTFVQPFNIVITTFPQSVGEFYVGNFSGQFKDVSNVTHTITSSFRVRRIM
jgi:hypothetical protein